MQVEFVGQSAQDDGNRAANTSRLINFYREAVNGSETQFSLRSVLGQESFSSVANNPDAATVDGTTLYVLASGFLYTVDAAGNATNRGAVTASGNSSLAPNNGVISIASGGVYQTWNGTTIATPSTGNFASIGSVDFLKGYTIYTQKDGPKWGWSDLLDATTLPGLNFATAEARDDNCIRVLGLDNNAWIFKEKSIEIWYPTGESGADAFFPMSGGVIDVGLEGYDLITKFPGGAFFVGTDGVAYVTIAGAINPVSDSHPGVSESIANDTPTACFYYTDRSHKFCAITFANRPAWVLDIATGEWHERADGSWGAWTASRTVDFGGEWRSVMSNGRIYTMTRNGADVSGPLIRRARSKVLYVERPFTVPNFEIFGRVGWSDLGRDAQCWLRVSNDRGHNWSRELWRSMGAQGEYDKAINWRALGRFTSLTAEIGVSDPYDVTFNSIANLVVN